MTEAIIMILGEPFLVTPKAPILPEYEVTPTPDPIKGLSHVSTKYRPYSRNHLKLKRGLSLPERDHDEGLILLTK